MINIKANADPDTQSILYSLFCGSQSTWITQKYVSPFLPLSTPPMRVEPAVHVTIREVVPMTSTNLGVQGAPGPTFLLIEYVTK